MNIKSMIRRVAQLGLPKDMREKVIQSMKGEDEKPVKISREVIKNLANTLASGSAVVTRGRSGKIKIYTLKGWQATSESAKKHKPWLKKENQEAPGS